MRYTLFFSRLRDRGPDAAAEYFRHADRLEARVLQEFPGFLDMKTFVAQDGERLAVVRFQDAAAQQRWAEDREHREAQEQGRTEYYDEYRVAVCDEVQSHSWSRNASAGDAEASASGDGEEPEMFPETLDPESWEEFRGLAHRMLDQAIDGQRDVRHGPAWRPLPAHIEQRFRSPVPMEGGGAAAACKDYLEMVLPYPTGLAHPRWWGWAGGTGSPMGMLAAMLGASTNSVPGNFNDAATRVESQLLAWMKSAMGFPADASGVVTSGATVANLIGLTVARDAAAASIAEDGIPAAGGKLVLYASTEVHSSVFKAARLLGLGRNAVRLVEVDDQYRILVPRLREQLQRDRQEGLRPFALVGTAGTINTGSIDDLNALADVAQEEGLWYHVDGAFGAMAALSPETRDLVSGMERADSLAFDFHKWMSVNYEAGCVLIKDAAAHRRSFAGGGSYLDPLPRGTGSQLDTAAGRGLELSRGFKALKPWMSLREHGLARFGRLVVQNMQQARYVAGLLDASEVLARVAPVALNVVAFRCEAPGLPAAAQDQVNRELLMRIQERGIAIPSATRLGGRFTLRVCICNHRSRKVDFDDFVHQAEAIAREVLDETLHRADLAGSSPARCSGKESP